jgi:Tfp pilus tip-associated adhesin PilY1
VKKYLFILLIALVMFLAACSDPSIDSAANEPTKEEDTTTSNDEKADKSNEVEQANKEETETEKDDVPREYKNALKAAQNYIDLMAFSEKGLFEQLTSEYGDQYPKEAAQYAIENVVVDYKEEALESAINYQDTMPMSDQELFDQLTSEYGEQFTEEQAQYAIDNLPN